VVKEVVRSFFDSARAVIYDRSGELLIAVCRHEHKRPLMSYDLLIRNGTVIDDRKPGYRADVAVKNGQIVVIGTVMNAPLQTINADDLSLAPALLIHITHYDAQIDWMA
jgi:adenine deaminase